MHNTLAGNVFLYGFVVCAVMYQGCAAKVKDTYGRSKEALTEWQFCQDTSPEGSELVIPRNAEWIPLSIPHVYRLSGLPEQSAGWYRRSIPAEENEYDKRFWLFLEGAGL